MKTLLLALSLLAGCATTPAEPLCTTRCGIQVMGAIDGGWPDGWDCARVQAVEDATTVDLARYVRSDARFADVCSRVRGYDLWLHPDMNFDYNGATVNGLTFCDTKTMVVGANPLLFRSSLPHEMSHAVQNCMPLVLNPEDFYHGGWEIDINDAIEKVRAR